MQIAEFNRIMFKDLHDLHLADVSFVIFDIDLGQKALYAGLNSCCGRNAEIRNEIRQDFEDQILSKTEFKEVIWEL